MPPNRSFWRIPRKARIGFAVMAPFVLLGGLATIITGEFHYRGRSVSEGATAVATGVFFAAMGLAFLLVGIFARDDGESPDGAAAAEKEAARFPPVVRAAAWLWIAVGAVIVVVQATSFWRWPAALAADIAFYGDGGSVLLAGVGAAFLIAGWRTLQDRAEDILGPLIGSFLFAPVFLAVAVVQYDSLPNRSFCSLAAAVGLLTAGLLALKSRRAFRRWKSARQRAAIPNIVG